MYTKFGNESPSIEIDNIIKYIKLNCDDQSKKIYDNLECQIHKRLAKAIIGQKQEAETERLN